MSDHRLPPFCDTALAQRLERAEVQLIAAASEAAHLRQENPRGFVLPVAGGVASFAEDGSPYNKVVGLGFGGVPTATEFDTIEEAYAAAGAPVQVELAHLADPELLQFLAGRGFRAEAFENVLGRVPAVEQPVAVGSGIEVRPSGDDEFEQWLEVVTEASMHPDTQGVPWREEFPRETYQRAERDSRAAGVTRYAALHNGVLAGGAGIRMTEGVAQFAGAATAPAHRRRGIQSALLTARLADAAAAGCDVAVITTQPGSKSQQNAQRRGFDLLYTRAVLVK